MALGKSASGQALGYLYQFERTLFWLADPNIDFVSIETDDDVVAELKAGLQIEMIYEQDKSVSGKANPFSNTNINLWKTLSIWLAIQKKKPSEKARFVLATNKRVSRTCVMYKLHRTNFILNYKADASALEQHYQDLIAAGGATKGKAKAIFDGIIADYSKTDLINLLSKIVLSCDEFQTKKDEFRNAVREKLRIGAQVPFNAVYTRILGWLIGEVIELWTTGKEGTIRSADLVDLKDQYVKESLDRPFIEQAISAIPVFDMERDQQKTKDFIRQLELIEATEDDKVEAIDDYLRATKERDRWAEAGTIPGHDDIINFEADLSRKWGQHFKKNLLTCKARTDLTLADVGNLVYIDCSLAHGYHLAGYPVIQSYTVTGGMHILSNKLKIGWHPEWQKKFSIKNKGNED
ncbi:ABC-three component system protein [Arcticibacter tournemirensis]